MKLVEEHAAQAHRALRQELSDRDPVRTEDSVVREAVRSLRAESPTAGEAAPSR